MRIILTSLILTLLLHAVKSLSLGLPEVSGTRHAGRRHMDLCNKGKCPRISTSLFSQTEYYRRKEKLQSSETSMAGESFSAEFAENKIKDTMKRSRWRRSQARTIISLNANQTVQNVRIDPNMVMSNKKCHKYAMFKVNPR